jgi:major inositol transporter-like SP family MFS transporter
LRFCSILFFFGAVGTAAAPSFAVMLPARIVLGIAVGAAAATVPVTWRRWRQRTDAGAW